MAIVASHHLRNSTGVTEADLKQWGAKFGSPAVFVLCPWWSGQIALSRNKWLPGSADYSGLFTYPWGASVTGGSVIG